jgi:glycine C-acetyltransferase
MILMASNNYLDLCSDPAVLSAACAALQHYGCGTGSVSLLSGTQDIHHRLEARLADFYGREAAAVFPTGYSVNVGTISALMGPADLALVDMYAHASLIDGAKLAGCLTKFFKHRDTESLRSLLARLRAKYHGVLIITDGVFSMDGDVCRLKELLELKQEFGARLLIDEAHAVGVLGAHGKGTEEYCDAIGQTDVITGTLSKAPGGLGGFVVGSAEVVQYVRHFAGSYVFSTSLPPAVVGGLLAAFDIIEHDHERRERLSDNAAYFVRRLREAGCVVEATVTPIVPVVIGDENVTRRIASDLHDQGIFASPVTFPAVAKTRSRIRFSVMSSHTREELDSVVEAMAVLVGRYGIVDRMERPS